MARTLTLTVAAFALIISSGVVQGLWTDRWQTSPRLEEQAARLRRIPVDLGDWKGEPIDLDPVRLTRLGVVGHMARRFTHRFNGTVVLVIVVCGRPGHIAVHTPEVCFGSVGYEPIAPPERLAIPVGPGGRPAEFKATRFAKQPRAPKQLRAFWSWSATGDWLAPDNPRLTFSRHPFLYKLYVIQEVTVLDRQPKDDPCLDLIDKLLTELGATLFAEANDLSDRRS